MERQDQSLSMYAVPQPMEETTRSSKSVANLDIGFQRLVEEYVRSTPRFHRQLYIAVTGPRCCGWQISIKRSGEAICASEFPKPKRNLPAT